MNNGQALAEMKPTKIGKFLERDVKNVCRSLYSLNAPYACGYVFNPNGNNKEVGRGMYASRGELYNDSIALEWTYYYDFESKEFFKFVE